MKGGSWYNQSAERLVFFTGVIEVELHEDKDGHITLIGYPSQPDNATHNSGSQRTSPKFQRVSSNSDMETSTSSMINTGCQQAECSAPDLYR